VRLDIFVGDIGIMLGNGICTASSSLGSLGIMDLDAISSDFLFTLMAFWCDISAMLVIHKSAY